MLLVIALVALSAVSAHVYDPELNMDYHVWSHRNPYLQEVLIIDLYPHPATTVSVGTIECPLNVSWDPSKTLSSAQLSKHINTCWESHVAKSPGLDDSQISKLSNENLMTLLYRNKIYSSGHIKIAYLAANKKEKAGLYFDLPPITPGEYRCAAWHQEAVHMSYSMKKKRYDLTAEYLIATGRDASEFKKWPEHPVLTDMTILKTDEALIKQALSNICTQLAQAHVDLAKRLHERDKKNRISKVICVKTAEYVRKLPDLPLFILPLDYFIEIKTFLDHSH